MCVCVRCVSPVLLCQLFQDHHAGMREHAFAYANVRGHAHVQGCLFASVSIHGMALCVCTHTHNQPALLALLVVHGLILCALSSQAWITHHTPAQLVAARARRHRSHRQRGHAQPPAHSCEWCLQSSCRRQRGHLRCACVEAVCAWAATCLPPLRRRGTTMCTRPPAPWSCTPALRG